jgi:hypothetical protein
MAEYDPTLAEALLQCTSNVVPITVEDTRFLHNIRRQDTEDKLFALILAKPQDFCDFAVTDGLIQ